MRFWGGRTGRIQAVGVAYMLVFLIVVHIYFSPSFDAFDNATPEIHSTSHKFKEERYHIEVKLGGAGVATLFLKLKRSRDEQRSGSYVCVGEHDAQVVIDDEKCIYPRFALRLFGDALVPFELQQGFDDQKHIWNGKFVIPFSGKYTLDARWYGCESSGKMNMTYTGRRTPDVVKIEAIGLPTLLSKPSNDAFLFASGAWVSKSRLRFTTNTEWPLPTYVWADAGMTVEDSTANLSDLIMIQSDEPSFQTVVSKRGTIRPPNGMYRFDENGNYELVCFWGGQSMWELWQIFLYERRFVSPGQRPFKFHYYNVTSLIHPDRDWPLSEKKRSRKCKHIFFSMDEIELKLSQAAFEEQLSTFIMHLVKMLNDPTFPIWILTTTEPAMSATSCQPTQLPRSTDHPCNAVFKRLFRPSTMRFPSQVHLMDNTDLVLPRFGESRHEILANVALRVFVAVGKGVADWRAMGQHGLVDGLHRNGTVEPNPELFPYEGWN